MTGQEASLYAVEVRDHVMIAHSLPDPLFGPAQKLHGATYVVDAAFMRPELTEQGVVVDIGRAREALRAALAPLDYGNLDELLPGRLTTTEYLCRHIYERLRDAARAGALGPGAEGLTRIRVTLSESHLARAWHEGPA
ncbi:6-pyruvoyl trahydropterin synthase family protein [Oceanicella actignis]|uniref:6-carboxy-5,6,7,8-tetrahydropterin synthase n=1 Tax=Oceanicella actignis TaxID=1189325 RepID=A0A1M7SEG2_9RHOB|nr:6-carboxytetrahydropterin synthase [Oceanicella actignis]TYO91341.1 6-pyruvoyl tetrahydropterin synthase-like protein [Oceanicella actignis]SET23518.1 6-pyruvoyl tetrahydropterin synthase [Oceanicella actignis]SHN56843.1 6-pyruvoyl tetrahydropterin synthase [Oceanicella actignis]